MADNYEMEGLEFQIIAESDKAISNLDTVSKKLSEIMNKLKLATANNQLAKLNATLSSIKTSVEAVNKASGLTETLEKLGTIKISSSIPKNIREIGSALDSITTEKAFNITTVTNALKELNGTNAKVKINVSDNVKSTSSKIKDVTEQVTKNSGMSAVKSKTEEVSAALDTVKKKMSDAGEKTEETKSRFDKFKSTLSRVKDGFMAITSRIKSLVSGFAKAGKAVASVTKKFLSFVKTVTLGQTIGSKLGSSVSTFTSKIGKLFSSLKRIAFYRLIRTIISSITNGFKEGMQNLYQYSLITGTQFAPNMDRLATSALYLKNSLGALTEPIVARLAPAVDLLVDKFVDLLNIVNQVISTLNGQDTYTAAKKYATSWAEAADGTKSAVNEIKRSILGFDELNVLTGNKDKGSSAAGNALDYSQMFEQRAISSSVKNFVDNIKSTFKEKDFVNIGKNIAKWINKGINKIPDVKIGVTIGNAINNINDYFYGMLDTLDTQTLGEKVGSNFTAAVRTINWGNLGRTVGTYGNRLLDFWNGVITQADLGGLGAGLGDFFARAVKTYNWGKLGETIGIGFTKIAEFFGNLVEHAELGDLGSSLAEFINRALDSTNWGDIGANTAKVFNGIADFFYNLITKTDWKNAGGAVGTFLTNAFKNIKWKEVGATVAGAITGIGDFIVGFFDKTDFKEVGKGLGDAIKSLLKNLNEWLGKQDFIKLGKDIGKGAVGIVSGIDIGNILLELATLLYRLITGSFKLALGFDFGIAEAIGAELEKAFDFFDDVSWDEWKDTFKLMGSDIAGWFKDGWNSTVKSVKDLLGIDDNLTWEAMGKALASPMETALEPLREYFDLEKQKKNIITNAATAGRDAAIYAAILQNSQPWSFQSGDTYSNLTESTSILGVKIDRLKTALEENTAIQKSALDDKVKNAALKGLERANSVSAHTGLETLISQAGADAPSEALARLVYSVRDIHGSDTVSGGLTSIVGNALSGLTASVSNVLVSDEGKRSLADSILSIATRNNVGTVQPTDTARTGFFSRIASWAVNANVHNLNPTSAAQTAFAGLVAGQRLTGNVHTVQPIGGAIGNLVSTVAGQRLTGNVHTVSPTSNAWSHYYRDVQDYGLTGTVSNLQLAANVALVGVAAAKFALSRLATGGVVSNGRIASWNSIPKYASGTVNAHGSLFVAGEAGAEIVGNVNGKTEILNKSQMAQAMYSASVAGMVESAKYINAKMAECANAVISAITYTSDSEVATRSGGLYDDPDDNVSTLIDGVREGVYEATAQQNDLLRQQNEILLDILAKDNTAQISTNSVVKALAQKNRRDGKYVVPVGIT